jgi:hypothetical protein
MEMLRAYIDLVPSPQRVDTKLFINFDKGAFLVPTDAAGGLRLSG